MSAPVPPLELSASPTPGVAPVLVAELDLPGAWQGLARWHLLAAGDAATPLWQTLLATWEAWQPGGACATPQTEPACPPRPALWVTLVCAGPCPADALLAAAAHHPLWRERAQHVATLCTGLLPGTHHWLLANEQLHLTLHLGALADVLPTLDTAADAVVLPPPTTASTWSEPLLKGLGRLCRNGTRLTAQRPNPTTAATLTSVGFACTPTSTGLQATYAPRWVPRHAVRGAATSAPQHVVVVGAGLAGSAVAWSLAQRGWQVEVLDQADHAASGASALPAGVVAPHASPDDAVLSRMSRAGVRLTLQRAAQLLTRDVDWAPSGVLEHRVEGKRNLPRTDVWAQAGAHWSRAAQAAELQAAHLPPDTPALWHGLAGWIRPAQLVHAQLQHPAVTWRGQCTVHSLRRVGALWQLLDAQGQTLASAEHVVLATAYPTRALLEGATSAHLPLNPLRGQVSWGPLRDLPATARSLLPPFPVNGHGSWVSGMAGPGTPDPMWLAGSTFERGETQALLKPEDQAANHTKLARLLPGLGAALPAAFAQAQMWAGVRCTLSDRLPAVGPVNSQALPGLYVCTGLGARGLTLSVLCGEVLAAWLHGEPWPAERKLALALLAERFVPQSP